MRIFAVGTKILGGGLANIWGPMPPGPNVEPPLSAGGCKHPQRPQTQSEPMKRVWRQDFGSFCANNNCVFEANLVLYIFQGRASAPVASAYGRNIGMDDRVRRTATAGHLRSWHVACRVLRFRSIHSTASIVDCPILLWVVNGRRFGGGMDHSHRHPVQALHLAGTV